MSSLLYFLTVPTLTRTRKQTLARLGDEISEVEQQREDAEDKGETDVSKYTDQIKALRKQITALQTKLNTTSLVQQEEQANAWERFSETLQNTPLLKDIFGLGNTEGKKCYPCCI
jgi:vacuolar-type H+-ATPase subunit I/STV1